MIRRRRRWLDLSQPQLSARCLELGWKVDPSVISKIESGRRALPVDEFVILATALEWDAFDVLDAMAGVLHREVIE